MRLWRRCSEEDSLRGMVLLKRSQGSSDYGPTESLNHRGHKGTLGLIRASLVELSQGNVLSDVEIVRQRPVWLEAIRLTNRETNLHGCPRRHRVRNSFLCKGE